MSTPSCLTTGQPPRRATTDWEISPGMIVHGYAFSGQASGFAIEARVGDTLLVHLTNLLPEPTTIRWRCTSPRRIVPPEHLAQVTA